MSTESITLQARQERTTMQVTSVEFRDEETVTVSYTHLTLPTIYSV